MTRMILIVAFAALCAAGQAAVPKGAKEVEPGVFRHTDSAGKTYLYRKTPFGVTKSLETAEKAEAPRTSKSTQATTPFGASSQEKTAEGVKVRERGDVLEFERPSPFGVSRWTRKKDELTEAERDLWERSRSPRPTANTETDGGRN